MPSTRRPRGERGAGTLEYVGMTTVAAALVLALLLVASATGIDAAVAFRNAICNALSLPCGGSSDENLALDRKPTDPCTVSTDSAKGEGGGSGVVVAVDGSAALITTRKSDGTYEVTLLSADGVAVTTGVGGGVNIETGAGTVGNSASASAEAGLSGGSGQTWTGLTKAEAQKITADLKPAVQAATTGPFRDFVRDGWEFLDGQDELRQPDQIFVHGSLQAGASAEVAAGPGGASAEATAAITAIAMHDRTKDTYTISLSGNIGGTAGGGLVFGPQGGAALGAGATIQVTIGEDGKPRSLVLSGEATTGLFSQLGLADGGDDTVFDNLAEQYTGDDTGAGGTTRTEATLTLDLTNPENAEVAAGLLQSVGVTAIGGQPIVNSSTVDAGARLAQRLYETGTLSLVEYETQGTSYGIAGDVKLGLVAGLSTGMSFDTANATRARYWDGRNLVELPGCVA